MRARRPWWLSHPESGRHARRIRGSGLGRRSRPPHGRHRLRRRQAGVTRRSSSPPLVRSRMSAPSFSFHPAAIEEALSAARWYHERSPLAAGSAWHPQTQAPLFSVLGDLSRIGRIRPDRGRGPRASAARLLERAALTIYTALPLAVRG